VRAELKVSERRICRVLGQHRSTQRRLPVGRDDDDELTADIVALVRQYGRYGYRKIAELLRSQAGWVVNDKRPYRQICSANRLSGNGRADLATRRAEGSHQATQEGPPLARRRIVYPPSCGTPQSCLVLRFRRGSHP
jgi:hypothetical protein